MTKEMETINEVLDAALAKIGKESDNQLAIAMGVTRAAVSSWRTKRCAPDAYALMELQKILGMDARQILAIIEAERAKTEERRGYWEGIKRSFSAQGVAAVVASAALIGALATPSPAQASTGKLTNAVYIM